MGRGPLSLSLHFCLLHSCDEQLVDRDHFSLGMGLLCVLLLGDSNSFWCAWILTGLLCSVALWRFDHKSAELSLTKKTS